MATDHQQQAAEVVIEWSAGDLTPTRQRDLIAAALDRAAADAERRGAIAALETHATRLGRVLAEMDEYDTRRPTLALVIEGLAEDADLRRHVSDVMARAALAGSHNEEKPDE